MTKNDNNPELAILSLADYAERFDVAESEAYLIINNRMSEFPCMFGFTRLTDDFATTRKLFRALETKAKNLGYKQLIGPVNYTTWLSYRWAIDHPELKIYPDCNNPLYYVSQIKELGYRELYTYRSATILIDNALCELGKQSYKQKIKEGYEFKLVSNNPTIDQIKDIYDISIAAFAGGPLYSELPYPYFEKIYLQWLQSIEPIAYVAYKNNRAVGFVMGYMNPYSDNFVSKTSAVLPEYQHQGIYAALVYLGCEYIRDLGLDKMIFHYQCEQRPTFRKFSTDKELQEKHYAVFIKEIE